MPYTVSVSEDGENYTVVYKYISSVKPFGVEIDDLVQEGMIALNKAINTFNDDNSVLFYTYASVCVERQIITYCTRIDSKKNYCLNHSYFDERYYCIGDEKNFIEGVRFKEKTIFY